MPEQNDFYTLESLSTFGGCIAATTVVNSVLRTVHRALKSPLFGLAIAILITITPSCILPALDDMPASAGTWFVSLINGFLVYAATAGLVAGADRAAHGPNDLGGGASHSSWRWY